MKNGKKILSLFVFLILATGAWAQFPFYDLETQTVCQDSAGTRQNLVKVNLYILGRSDIVSTLYFDVDGSQVVPGGGVTVYDAPCWEVIQEDTVGVLTFESAFSSADYTIQGNTYDEVSIVNLGSTTHLITFQASGGTMRLLPGEAYYFHSSFDEYSRKKMRNPTIVISQGVTGINYLRVYAEAK